MFICRIDGTLTSTAKHSSLKGLKLLIGQRVNADGTDSLEEPWVLIDKLGAGIGSKVMVSTDGELARKLAKDNRTPSRLVVVGILD